MNVLQIVLITLLAAWKKIDQKGPQVFIYNTVFWGALAGLIMGDVKTGLTIGATFQLMSLGVAAIGGTSVPDYQIGAIIAIAIAVSTGKGVEAGIAVGLPVAMLAVQLDVLGNIIHGVFVRKAQQFAKEQKWSSFNLMYITALKNTKKAYYLIDHSKVNAGDKYNICDFSQIDTVISDYRFPAETKRNYPNTAFCEV